MARASTDAGGGTSRCRDLEPGIAAGASASSFHPGGMNAAYADGSVHFLKDTINTMPYDASTGLPLGMAPDANGILQVQPGAQYGVWQALSTRAGGEIISADAL